LFAKNLLAVILTLRVHQNAMVLWWKALIDIELIKAIIIYGAISGGMYALLALGFTLIYGVSDVINLAHGSLFMIGTYIFFVLATPYGGIQIPLIPALLLAAIFVAIIGVVTFRLTIHPVIEDPLSIMVVTISLAMIIQESMVLGFGSYRQPVPSLAEGLAIIWGVKVTYSKILAFVVSLALFAILMTFVTKTKIGRGMRAVSQDREVAMLMGVNTERLYMLTMAISGSLAAVAGMLIVSSTAGVTYPHIWPQQLYLSFAVVILGGLGSIKGSLVGAFIISYVESTFVFAIDPIIAGILNLPVGGSLSGAVIMAAMLLVILIRPKGLFGKRVELEE
jgi:branched-chain amino acid transport system permease protein